VAAGHGDVPCMLFEGNDPSNTDRLTYSEVLVKVCQLVSMLMNTHQALLEDGRGDTRVKSKYDKRTIFSRDILDTSFPALIDSTLAIRPTG